ncbi:MAG TPA: nucleotidyltransferase family protein [Alphaproteobacteria bacterium]|nr:nucleotidyltransferase family protein [Alphaproteobacteria bacterium]
MSAVPKRAMVLAAGLGKRMRPLTDVIPKPMVEVAGQALIDHVLDRFAAIEVRDIVVNLHHLGHKLEAHLSTRCDMRITLSPESELLETGGGVTKALPLLGREAFFAANADVLWYDGATPALARLSAMWDEAKMDALLLLQRTVTAHGYEGQGDYFLDPLGRAKRRRGQAVAPYVFAGVQILHPRLFKDAPQGAFSLNRLYDRAEEAERLFGVAHDGLWFHVGTPDSIAATEAELDYVPPARGERRTAAS